jgi:hypothetical protein
MLTDMATAGLGRTVPALPVRDVPRSVTHFSECFGFSPRHATADFAVVSRDEAIVHLWSADDESWSGRDDLTARPVHSGAESFLAGTASCRIETQDVDALYAELRETGVLHPVSRDGITTTDFGTREFATLDLDGNLLSFYRWI